MIVAQGRTVRRIVWVDADGVRWPVREVRLGPDGRLVFDGRISAVVFAQPGRMAWAGGAGVVASDVAVVMVAAALVWTGGAGGVSSAVAVDAVGGTLAWVGGDADLISDTTVGGFGGVLSWSGGSASVDVSYGAILDPGELVWIGGTGAVVVSTDVSLDPGVLSWSGGSADVSTGAVVDAAPGVLVWVGGDGEVTADTTVLAAPGVLVWTGGTAALSSDSTVDADPGTLSWTGGTGEVWASSDVDGGTAAAGGSAGGVGPDLDGGSAGGGGSGPDTDGGDAGAWVLAAPGVLVWTGGTAALSSDSTVDADPGTLSWTGGTGTVATTYANTGLRKSGTFTTGSSSATRITGWTVDPAFPATNLTSNAIVHPGGAVILRGRATYTKQDGGDRINLRFYANGVFVGTRATEAVSSSGTLVMPDHAITLAAGAVVELRIEIIAPSGRTTTITAAGTWLHTEET